MGMKHIINREKKQDGCIYFYVIDDENFVAYELSAYILTHLYPSVTLENKYVNELGTNIYVAQFGTDICREHFLGDNVLVSDDYIQVFVAPENGVQYKEWVDNFVQSQKQRR
jgi:hypothetical protein